MIIAYMNLFLNIRNGAIGALSAGLFQRRSLHARHKLPLRISGNRRPHMDGGSALPSWVEEYFVIIGANLENVWDGMPR
jgi:hypothetical protein